MSTLFNQHLFVPENLEWFEQELENPDPGVWMPDRLEREAFFWRECAISNWPISTLLNKLIAPPWSEQLPIEAPEAFADWKALLLRAEAVPSALVAHDRLNSDPTKLAKNLLAVVIEAGWPAEEDSRSSVELVLRQRTAPHHANSDDVPVALATAWAQRVEALRHAGSREAPLVCIIWRY